ncbi:hypothetical protein ACVILK_000353 [Bradyrhizobium embrapense]
MDTVALRVNPPDQSQNIENNPMHSSGGGGKVEKRLDASGNSAVHFHYSEMVRMRAMEAGQPCSTAKVRRRFSAEEICRKYADEGRYRPRSIHPTFAVR